jgi:Polyketide cyclase / dehydrase and lipid transport
MVRIEKSRIFPVEREVGFDYITKPTNWSEFWPDLVDITNLEQTRWQQPGDTARLQMKLAGRLTELQMTLDELSPPALVRYHSTQQGVPDAMHERRFEPAAGGFEYTLVVSFDPRTGVAGLFDRTVVRYATSRALRRTLDNLAQRLPRSASRAM